MTRFSFIGQLKDRKAQTMVKRRTIIFTGALLTLTGAFAAALKIADNNDPVAAAAAKVGFHGEVDGVYGQPSDTYCEALGLETTSMWFKAKRDDGTVFRWQCRGGLVVYGAS
jgi:hypothetical protein